MSCLVRQSKILFLAFTKPYLQLFLQLAFLWQKSCVVYVMHDATSSILLNSTNEANTFLTMYNIIRFSRLSKLVWSTLYLNFPETAIFKRPAEELLCAERRRSKNDQRLWVHCEVQLQTLLYVTSRNRIYHFIVFFTLMRYFQWKQQCYDLWDHPIYWV